ncbi:adenylate/guanylate cyclase catalytic domain protein [Cooperia oncophora]
MGCGEAFEGVAVGADMYHVQKVRAFIGPYCNAELDAVAKMATFWNIPVVGYMASSNAFADKSIYRTLARVSLRTTNSLAEAVAAILNHYNWTKDLLVQVGVATNTGVVAFERFTAFEEVFNKRKIEITKKVMFDENADAKAMEQSGLLEELSNNARGEIPANLYFSIQSSCHNGSMFGFLANIYGYIHLYDALRLYAIAVRTAMNRTGNPDIYQDGRYIWNQMRRITFPGLVSAAGVSSGTVMMDDIAERAPIYAAFHVPANSDTVRKVNEIEPKLISNCDGLKTKTGCFDLQITDVMTGFWPSPDGEMPKEEPACGFRNERCDYTMIIIAGVLLTVLILSIVIALIMVRVCENRALARMPWRIYRDDFRVIGEEEFRSMLSIGSTSTKLSNSTSFAKHHAVLGTNTHASFHVYPQRRPITFNRVDMQLLTLMKQSIHDNLESIPWHVVQRERGNGTAMEILLPWYCAGYHIQQRDGTGCKIPRRLHQRHHLGTMLQGLEYLHSSPIGFHGSLTPWACLIDRNWMVKLTDFGIADSLERWEKQGLIATETLKEGDDEGKSGSLQKTIPRKAQYFWNNFFRRGSLVDQMMHMMEQYANNLEKLVQERTGMLEDANARADKLLSQLLPKYVANELKLGRPVPPKMFQSATVFFSSAEEVILAFFKNVRVETIGDAYMVVSGIPEENGTRHIMHISDIALENHGGRYSKRTRSHIVVQPDYVSVLVTTAALWRLVSSVNMASRMESTSEPEKIQMSESAHDMLAKFYPEYKTELRGTVDVKGKGTCTTYWLLGREMHSSPREDEVFTGLKRDGYKSTP